MTPNRSERMPASPMGGPSPLSPPVEPGRPMGQTSTEATILLIIATIAALYLGRDVFIPLALAILLSFALGPAVTRLYRLGIGRVPAVLIVMFFVTLLLAGFASLVASQLLHLADSLPRYEANLRAKAQAFTSSVPGSSVIDRLADLMDRVGRELESVAEDTPPAGGAGAPTAGESQPRPIPVEVHEPPPPPLQALQSMVGPLLEPIATAGIVLVFIIFVLLQREDLRDRLIRLFGLADVHRATDALTDAAKRIGRYLLMQLVINVLYGLPVGIGLHLIGVPNALLWGVLATVLRFIPYLGPILAAVFPIALSFAVDPGWTTPLLTIALFIGLELFSNNVLEPWLYGSSTGLSPLAVIVAAVFWTTLWGPVGLLLSTPLTVCLVVLGHHVPQLHFFEVLLGNRPALAPEVKFYQRLLANDPHEAEELAADRLEESSLADAYGEVILPALALADQDRLRGVLDGVRAAALAEAARGVADRLAELVEEAADSGGAPAARVLCLGGRNSFDLTGAVMLAHVLRRKGLAAEAFPADILMSTGRLAGYDAVAVVLVDPRALRQARRLLLRLRTHPETKGKPVCLTLAGLSPSEAEAVRAATGAERLAGSLQEAAAVVRALAPAAPELVSAST